MSQSEDLDDIEHASVIVANVAGLALSNQSFVRITSLAIEGGLFDVSEGRQ
jgi:hypothetical protein